MASAEAEDLAALAGFTVAFFNSNTELKNLFSKAMRENWTGDRLLQAARNTSWFKTHSSPEREAILLKTSDPDTYKANVAAVWQRITNIFTELGVPVGYQVHNSLAFLAYNNGWNDEQIRAYLGRYNAVRGAVASGKTLGGTIGQVQARVHAAARDYGVVISNAWLSNYLQKISQGTLTEQDVMAALQKLAAASFPGLADQIKAGETVRDIAEPYMQSMAKLWETNPESIDLFNPVIRTALNTKGQNGKFSMLTLPEFETRLRKDSRWLATDNAQDAMMENGHQVLNAFGVTW
jgi:hypothetical protein